MQNNGFFNLWNKLNADEIIGMSNQLLIIKADVKDLLHGEEQNSTMANMHRLDQK